MLDRRESSTYQEILEIGLAEGREKGRAEGEAQGLRNTIFRIGGKRFGPPTATNQATLEAINDLTRLQALTDLLAKASAQ